MDIKKEYERWLANATADADVAAELKTLDDAKVEDAFYRDLAFGTGGLRGVIGAGTNRIEEPQFIERSAAIEQQIRERKQQLSRNDMSNTSEKILQKTRLIQKKLSSTPPLELFDESVFKELVKKVLISNTAIQFELINGMKLSESRAAT